MSNVEMDLPQVRPQLDLASLVGATEAEAAYHRVWMPPEPWWDALVDRKQDYAAGLLRRLERGARWPRSEVASVRKPGHGIRPVALMSPDVRIIYRAIVSALVPAEMRADRSIERYAEFIVEPIRAAYTQMSGLFFVFGDTNFSHVVVTDVAAFYQYIDHALLRDELDLAGMDLALTDSLIALLGQIEGRSFGIPQRSEPSDWISEFYVARLERWLVRDGFEVWRYSDDFRIGCTSYAEALRAIESLSRAARDMGLILNDQKTATPSFMTYYGHNVGAEIHDSDPIDPSDVEAAVSTDYVPDDDDQAVAEARLTIDRLWDPDRPLGWQEGTDWDLGSLDPQEHGAVRRAMNTLTRHSDTHALPRLLSILTYQPSLTHKVVDYAESVSLQAGDAVEAFFDQVMHRLSLTEWQRAWVAHGLCVCGVELAGQQDRLTWLNDRLAGDPHSLSAAAASVALASAGSVSFNFIEGRLRLVPDDLAPWYLHALAMLQAQTGDHSQQVAALRHFSGVASAILA